ncbi:hypothetical protein [Xanthocytophaga agilis]|uniref:DUF1963 domain-containing protein n=1 Tax=Xanthocytophaga agilis TaxID=3048010 RepID=A0AAE3UBT3_9BACT|nr:hypothetical protein [Xanthocytophaga agilis]MDJ1499395.1 hypothetical protein [Xanthocytophaga agilis]
MEGLKLCPQIHEVFFDQHEEYKKYFKPLVSINLSLVNPQWNGQLFIVYSNNDPYCTAAQAHMNTFCHQTKVTFDIVDGKYKFKADFGYFQTNTDWKEWLEMGNKSYSEFLTQQERKPANPKRYIRQFNKIPKWIQMNETPLNSRGDKMTFICQMNSGDIISDYCEEEIYLFYDDFDKVAVQIQQID